VTAIRINPEQVRGAGIAAVTCADDLRGQAAYLQAMSLPAMPVAMAARFQAALASAATRLGALANEYGMVGQELQVRAAAADAADASGESQAASAGRQLATSVVSTTTIVGAAGSLTSLQLTVSGTRVDAATSTGLSITIPDALERAAPPAAPTPVSAPDPQQSAHERPAAGREVDSAEPVGGAPAAALAQAVAAAPSRSGHQIPAMLHGDSVDPAAMPPGEHRAEHHDLPVVGLAPRAAPRPSKEDRDRQKWACWMATSAARAGLPPTLPVMMALSRSGMRNMPGAQNDVGFFGLNPHKAFAPPGAGVSHGTQPGGDWWAAHPDAQLDHVMRGLKDAAGGIRKPGLDDPEALGRWASDAATGMDGSQFVDAHAAAQQLVSNCHGLQAGGAIGSVGAAHAGGALAAAKSQLGVHELGTNAGPQVNQYLASAGVGSGNPWCASFVTWSLHESGHDMPGGGWASVSTWVNAAQSGQHGLQMVDPAHARPGDIVAYDWGGGTDFSSDGHIGFLESHVQNGQFTTVEGNADDAVTRMSRNMGEGNVVFMRMAG
jgi:hypothetical protein